MRLMARRPRKPVERAHTVGGATKRVFDLSVGLLGVAAISPLLLALAAGVKLSGGGPIFYSHVRVGRHGRPFRCMKFRSMVVDSDRALARHLEANPEAAIEWATTRKLKKDPRVTPIGRLLRKTSLDELPQLFNIIRGEMSLVGPRPVVQAELEMYGPAASRYLSARPGLTGPWQISGRNDVAYDRRIALDQRYVETWSLMQDIVIVTKTIPAVLRARGSY